MTDPRLSSTLLLASFLLASGTVACGSEEPAAPQTESPGSGSAELTERARVLDDEGVRALSSVSEDGVYTFSKLSEVLAALAPGDVLIIGSSEHTPRGALRVVDSITPQGAGLVLETHPAEMADAFVRLDLELQTTLGESEIETVHGDVGQTQQELGPTFPISLASGSGGNRIELNGSFSVDSSLDFNLDFSWEAGLKELTLEFSGTETFVAELNAQGTHAFGDEITVGSVAFAPITVLVPIPVPPHVLPLIITPVAKFQVGLQGNVQGDVTASVTQVASFTAGLGYKNGSFQGYSDDSSSLQFDPPTFGASASVKAYAGPQLDVLVYGAFGPYAGVEAFVEAAASVEGPPPCVNGQVDAGLTAKAGIDFLADWHTVLFDERTNVAQFDTCSPNPNAPPPTITWSRSFGRQGSPGESAQAVTQAADGSYLVVGDSSLFDGVTGYAASLWAMRLDPLGNVTWQRAYQRTAQIGSAQGVVHVPEGFLVLGKRGLMKLDSGGNVVWAKTYASGNHLELGVIAAHPDGSLIVTGVQSTDTHDFVMKLDGDGKPIWARTYGGDSFSSVRVTGDGAAILVGQIGTDAHLVKIDSNGDVIFRRALDNRFDSTGGEVSPPSFGDALDRGFDVAEKPGGGYFVAAESYGAFPLPKSGQGGYYATWTVEVDAQGAITSSRVHRAPAEANYGGAYAVGMRPNGTPLVVGRRATSSTDLLASEDVLVIQGTGYSALGGPGHEAVNGGDSLGGFNRGMPLFMTSDGGAILAATSDSFAGQPEVWLVKLNKTGGINFPYRSQLAGASYENEHSMSLSLSSFSDELPITAEPFSVSFEVTPETMSVQNP